MARSRPFPCFLQEHVGVASWCSLCDSITFSKMLFQQHIDSLSHQQRSVINNHVKPNDDLGIVDNELYAKIKAQVKKELLEEIKNKLPEMFAQIN